MISNILNTVFTRVGLAIFAILLLVLNSNFLGSEGVGIIGIIILEIAIFLLFTNLICGGSMIYFTPRKSIIELFLSAYVWIAFCGLIGFLLIKSFSFFQHEYIYDVLLLGILQSISITHSGILAGKEQIKRFNSISLIQVIVQFLALLYFYYIQEVATIQSFIYSTYIAYFIALLVGLAYLFRSLQGKFQFPSLTTYKTLIQYGFYIQVSNIAQLFNYRLSYFILDYFSGKATLGQFMAGVQLSEGLLLPSKSIATVQFTKIANSKHHKRAANLTLKLLKLTLLITLPLIVLLLLIPANFYTALLSDDFYTTPLVIGGMAIGILGLSGEAIMSRYFSGTGQQKHNAISTCIGLVITLIAGLTLIPQYGFMGAAITSSCSFVGMFGYMTIMLTRLSHLRLSDFLYTKRDFQFFYRVARLVKNSL